MGLIQRMNGAMPTPMVDLEGSVGEDEGFTVAPAGRSPLVVIYHLDTNRGDATIVMGPELCVFVDCGFDWVSTRMLAIEGKIHGEGADRVLISHFDKDHFYGIQAVIAAAGKPMTIVTPADPRELDAATHTGACAHRPRGLDALNDDMLRRFQALVGRNIGGAGRSCLSGTCTDDPGVNAHTLRSARDVGVIDLGGGVTMRAVHNAAPQRLSTLRENNNSSIAWVLTAADVNYYTAGDLEEGEHHVSPGEGERFHIVKCGHHGSRAATSAGFLRRASPSVAILQGCAADYGHPMPEVLERLHQANVDVYATGLYLNVANDAHRPTVCGDAQTVAGDLAVVIWDDGVYSAHWCSPDGRLYDAWEAAGGQGDLDEREFLAIDQLELKALTKLTDRMNGALEAAKTQHVVVAANGGQTRAKRSRARSIRDDAPRDCEICLKRGRPRPTPSSATCNICLIRVCSAHEDDGECSDCADA